jgi:DNA-directed RNA polymerase specialized sigma24 family protein
MKGRCHVPTHENFAHYGGRGVEVCPEWRGNFRSFREWANRNGYAPGLQIDRIDNDKGYCPENCRFVSAAQNCQNKRARTRTIRTNPKLSPSQVREVRQLLADGLSQRAIAQRMGVSPSTVGSIKTGRTWIDVT